jgi:methionine synthase I (cobalamin-dependent)
MNAAAWCGVANKTHPEVVRRVHEEYIRAGADVVTANTFATCRHVLAGAGLADEAPRITARAVELAREAVEVVALDRPVAVAGSMSNNVAWIPGTFSPDPRFLPSRAPCR